MSSILCGSVEPRERNRAFWRALHGLTHEVCLAAIGILLLNDHFLRVWHPSWITGKLGDFTWLVFAPFIAALVFAGVVRGRRQETIVGIASFCFIGLWFTLAKTTAPVNRWTIDALAGLLGYRGLLRIDPTDLLALPGLWIGWKVWRAADNRPETLKARAWVFIAAGAVATVATSSWDPSHGIGRLCREGTDVLALEFPLPDGPGYVSRDGGRTWISAGAIDAAVRKRCGMVQQEKGGTSFMGFSRSVFQTTGVLDDGTTQYRVVHGADAAIEIVTASEAQNNRGHSRERRAIQRSEDGGKTWTPVFDLFGLDSEARTDLYVLEHSQNPTSGPQDALVSKGNVVFAMGTDGVLVHPSNAAWTWAPVGKFRHATYTTADRLTLVASSRQGLLSLLLALVFSICAFLTIGAVLYPAGLGQRVLVALAWILFGVVWMPVPVNGMATISLLILGPILAVLAALAARRVYRLEPHALVVVLATSTATGGLYFFPFVLWTLDTVPHFVLVQIYGFCLGTAGVMSSRIYLRRRCAHLR